MSDIEKELNQMAVGEVRTVASLRYVRTPGGWIVHSLDVPSPWVFVPDPGSRERYQRDMVGTLRCLESALQKAYL